ncbi:hypothetical protein ACFLWY_01490 [Chloroflexota bacterium]
MHSQRKLNRIDGLLLIAVMLLLGLYIYHIGYLNLSIPPLEDAAMVIRYEQHLAQGHGIVWNIGDKPVDGAANFLFVVLLAGLVKFGIPPEIATRCIGLTSHILTVIIVYIAIRKLHGSSQWLALISASFIAVGPALAHTEAQFGTPFFALFACITWYLANKVVKEDNSHITSVTFVSSGLIMGLIRPEGVFLAIFMLLSILYMRGWKDSLRVILYFVGIFAIIGGGYFFWRWDYFGYPLPNPYYVKGGYFFEWYSLNLSFRNFFSLYGPFLIPFAVAFVRGFKSPQIAQQAVFSLIPILGFIVLWGLLTIPANFYLRYQYPILPIVLIAWPALLAGIREEWNIPTLDSLNLRNRIAYILFVVVLSLGVLTYGRVDRNVTFHCDGRYDVAVMLNEYSHKGYTIAVTEAGLLPLYSNWRAVDTWGLNDQWIAHNGLTESYLDLYKPEVMMFHAYFSPIVPIDKERSGSSYWRNITVKHYAEKNGYILAAVHGDSPYDTHYYYVRPDFPDSLEIVERIRGIRYCWFANGKQAINYATLSLSTGK